MTSTPRLRRPRTLALAYAAALIVAFAAALSGAASTRAQGPASPPSACVTVSKASVNSRVALVGAGLNVKTSIVALCAGEAFPLHIVLVLDGSRSMAGEPTESLKATARQLVDHLDLPDNPGTEVGVVEINQPSKRLCALTNSVSLLHACIDRLAADGGSDIAGAVGIGIETMDAGRGSGGDRDSIREVLAILTDGGNSGGCNPLLSVAGQAKGQGILTMTACVTAGCDGACLQRAATSPRYFFEVGQMNLISNVFDTIRKQFQTTIVKSIALTETLGAVFESVPGSAVPEPRSSDGRRFEWLLTSIPRDGVTLSLGVRPMIAGFDLPLLSSAGGGLTDNRNRRSDVVVDVPRIDVLDARHGVPPAALTATLPVSNRLALDASRAVVGQRLRARYHLQLPAGDAERLNVAVVQLRAPDHIQVGATRRDGRPAGQADADGHGAQWLIVGTPADVLDLEAEFVATKPGEGGFGVVVYRWEIEASKPAAPVVAAVSAPITIERAPTPGPTSTATPRPIRVYLPAALAEACLTAVPSDVVAVVDASTSMAERLTGGGTKRTAVAAALAALSAGLRGDRDRLALVTFNRVAEIRRPLSATAVDADAVAGAYLGVPLSDGDAAEAGITAAGALLAGPERRPEARGVIVLVTDGRIYPGAAALAAAEAAKSAGIFVLAVGIGPEVNRPLLTSLASSPGHAFFAADGATLARTSSRIASLLGCEQTVFWGARTQ